MVVSSLVFLFVRVCYCPRLYEITLQCMCGPLSWQFHSAELSELNAECHYADRTSRIKM
jgi:hypothetical protein